MTSQTPENATPTEPTLLRPAEAARQLGIPASTLRRWSRRFASFLSPEANGAVRENGSRGHRRYTPRDMAVLQHCKALLSEGYTFQQVGAALESDFKLEAPLVEGEVDVVETQEKTIETGAEPLEMIREEDAVGLGQMMTQLLSSLSGSQQMLITGQQNERELLGVLIQDNFNLKEENKRLRERMVETERQIFEMKREVEKNRKDEQERMRQMEAYLFQLQRQMDDLVRRQAARPLSSGYPIPQVQPVAPAAVSPQPVRHPVPKASSAPSAGQTVNKKEASFSASSETPVHKKRSFWDWLLGR